jgi:hypothetical protein
MAVHLLQADALEGNVKGAGKEPNGLSGLFPSMNSASISPRNGTTADRALDSQRSE